MAKKAPTEQWQFNAAEAGRHHRGGSWATGFLIAKTVRPDSKGGKPAAEAATGGKVTATQFGNVAGMDKNTVLTYYKTWKQAILTGNDAFKLADPTTLTPESTWEADPEVHTDAAWQAARKAYVASVTPKVTETPKSMEEVLNGDDETPADETPAPTTKATTSKPAGAGTPAPAASTLTDEQQAKLAQQGQLTTLVKLADELRAIVSALAKSGVPAHLKSGYMDAAAGITEDANLITTLADEIPDVPGADAFEAAWEGSNL